MGIVLPVAVAAALLTTSANATTATPEPQPPATAAVTASVPSQAELEQRIAGAMAAEDTTGTVSRSPMSSGSVDSTVSPMVIGGTTTTIGSAPWMAQLWYTDDQGTADESDDTGFFCGGAVVAPTKILTAAHCVKDANWATGGTVVTGTAQLPSSDGDVHGGTPSAVLRQRYHPSYNADTIDNDIAVLTLATPVKVTPIRMTTSTDTASHDRRQERQGVRLGPYQLHQRRNLRDPGTGVFTARIKVRKAWTAYNAFDTVGDITGDGRADLLARTPGGTLYLYKGTGKATSEIFATRIQVGTGFQQYDIFG